MKHRPLKQLCGLLATAAIALVLIGCNGKSGATGANHQHIVIMGIVVCHI